MQAERSAVGPRGPRVDAVALARAVKRLQAAGQAPWLHEEAARRMAGRLSYIRKQPGLLVDASGPLGASTALLQAAYPSARHLALRAGDDPDSPVALKPWWAFGRKAVRAVDRVTADELPAGQADLLWSNMALHGQVDPEPVFAQWQQLLAVDGFLMFSTLGPGSLPELRDIHRQHGWGEPMLPFVDMHDLGDMLVRSGFADPVMDQERVTLTWPDTDALLAELRGLGANVSPRRFAGLRTPRWRERLHAALRERDPTGRPSLSFELVYGHAFRAPPKLRVQPETHVSLEAMRSMIRGPRT
jgi:malonyl-CoA O-methyltransferase